MDQKKQTVENDLGTLAEDARALMAATADVAGGKVREARERLSTALDGGRRIFGRAQAKAVEAVKATDDALHEHPYEAIGIAFAVGALIGFLAARQCSRNGD
ncbi:putative Protein ElaB [Verrucomicrobia bacterium]|nr:putative Protein ElaB [Verrucomicrobiota bacterium]